MSSGREVCGEDRPGRAREGVWGSVFIHSMMLNEETDFLVHSAYAQTWPHAVWNSRG